MSHATFVRPDLTTFTGLDQLGLLATGQHLDPERAVLACRVVDPDDWCRRCGCEGIARGTIRRRLAHEPFGWRPTTLVVTLRRYRCSGCGHVWQQDTSRAAEPRAKLSRAGLRWALHGLLVAGHTRPHKAKHATSLPSLGGSSNKESRATTPEALLTPTVSVRSPWWS